MKSDEKIDGLVRETFGTAEPVLASLRGRPTDGRPRAAIVAGVAGGAVGAIAAVAVTSVLKRRSESNHSGTNEPVEAGVAKLSRSSGPVLLVLTMSRLAGWDAKGKSLICDIPLSSLSGVATESSKLSPANLVLEIRSGEATARIEGTRGKVGQFAEAVAQQIGKPVDARNEEQPSFWLLRAFLVGILYFFGVCAMLLAIPQYSDKGPANAAVLFGIGAVMAGAGELARRRLLADRRPQRTVN
jgi:hypothetical protein